MAYTNVVLNKEEYFMNQNSQTPPEFQKKKNSINPKYIAGAAAFVVAAGACGFGGAMLANNMTGPSGVTINQQSGNSSTAAINDVSDIAAKCGPSVVEITTQGVASSGGLLQQQYITQGAGSGVIMSEDGYIITNHHVIEDATAIAVRTTDGQEYSAEIIGSIQPDFLGSVNTTLSYKNWSLSASFDMRFGGYVASYGSRYGTAYGLTETSLAGRDTEHGGITYTSMWDGKTYNDGVIPVGIIQGGTTLTRPDGVTYTVAEGGETFQQLYDKGIVEPLHASAWTYWNNSWGTGTVNDDWFTKLNYIAFRELSLSYRVPKSFCEKFHAKSLNLSFTGRNLGYLLNTMPNGENPESVRGTSASEFRVRSFNGYTASYMFTLNVGF